MNYFMVFDPSKPDLRCPRCRHHNYLVLSETDEIKCLHSYAGSVDFKAGTFPFLPREAGIHWWGRVEVEAPKCLKSYKKIGGTK